MTYYIDPPLGIIIVDVQLSQAGTTTCDEKQKFFSQDLELSCPDVSGNCTWFHVVDNSSISLERRFLVSNGSGDANLLGNDLYGFGKFIVRTTDNSLHCYQVCPVIADSSK